MENKTILDEIVKIKKQNSDLLAENKNLKKYLKDAETRYDESMEKNKALSEKIENLISEIKNMKDMKWLDCLEMGIKKMKKIEEVWANHTCPTRKDYDRADALREARYNEGHM